MSKSGVFINGIQFGEEQYANGETVFREVEIKGDNVKIEVVTETSGNLLIGAIAYLWVRDCYINKKVTLKVKIRTESLLGQVEQIKTFYKYLELPSRDFELLYVSKESEARFPENTIHLSTNISNRINFDSNDSIMDVLLSQTKIKNRNLIMYYIPYGRMDRQVANKIFALKYFAKIINAYHFENVYTCDIHNSTSRIINNLVEIPVGLVIGKVLSSNNFDVICFPDGGAYEKYPTKLLEQNLDIRENCVYGVKRRDEMESSNIVHYELETRGLDLRNKKVIIIDDICSTGSTMMKAAKLLKEAGAGKISMYVTHCEKSILNGGLLESGLFSRIYTTNSLPEIKDERFVRISIEKVAASDKK